MPCIAAPKIPVPTLPGGLSLSLPSLPTPSINPLLCCNINLPPVDLGSFLPAPPPGPVVNLAVLAAIVGAVINPINSFLDHLSVDCALE